MVNLDDVHGSGRGSNRHAKTQKEPTTHERTGGVGRSLDDCTNDDGRSTNEHADPSAPGINGGADKRKRDDTTNLVHGRDDSGPDAVVLDSILVLEPGVLQEVVDEGAIVAIHGRAE